MSKLVLLGTSAGKASAHRASSSYLLDLGNTGILMDCGDGATRNFLAAGYAPEWISEVIITHTHADHVCGFGYFIQQRYLSGTDKPITVRCPEEAAQFLHDLLVFGYMIPERLPFEIQFIPIDPKTEWTSEGVVFSAHPTTHIGASAAAARKLGYSNQGQCYAIRAVVNGTALLYSADLGSIDDLAVIDVSIDWLLIETTHVALDRLWPWAAERGITRIILTHIADDFDATVIEVAPKFTPADVIVAADNMIFDFS